VIPYWWMMVAFLFGVLIGMGALALWIADRWPWK
jgi:hypothetical protein